MSDVDSEQVIIGSGVIKDAGKVWQIGCIRQGVGNAFADNDTVAVGIAFTCFPYVFVIDVGIKGQSKTPHTFQQAVENAETITVIFIFSRFQALSGVPDFFLVQRVGLASYTGKTPVAFHGSSGNQN